MAINSKESDENGSEGNSCFRARNFKNIVQGRKNKFKLSFRDAALFHSLPRIFLMFLNASRKKPLDMNRASQSVDVHFQSSIFLVVLIHTPHMISVVMINHNVRWKWMVCVLKRRKRNLGPRQFPFPAFKEILRKLFSKKRLSFLRRSDVANVENLDRQIE